jgi:predicted dehydrogenase
MNDTTNANPQRRTIIQGMAAGAAAATLANAGEASAAMAGRKTCVIVGCGSRARFFQNAIWGAHSDTARLVAVCDTNPGRMQLVRRNARQAGAPAPTTYSAEDFDRMISRHRPDTVIVTTPDATHSEYIVRALDSGCDVITEKPMTTDAGKAQAILDAVARNDRHIRVAFNYRYAPFRSQVKQMLLDGAIGDILSVDFQWLLNTSHGADYFRRWHSNKSISGGLMVHKSTHHFDLVNWWLSDVPVSVNAVGKRDFYTPAMARRMGLSGPHERCSTCPEKDKCGFYLDVAADSGLNALYIENERYDGYFRDRCVFREDISIEDTMNVIVQYEQGATLSYSLNAFNAWEGYHVNFNGTKGRIEHSVYERGATTAGATGAQDSDLIQTRLIPLRGAAQNIEPDVGEGGHGGGDVVLLNDLFGAHPAPDPLMRAADERGGAASILIGAAANQCFETGQPVRIADMVTGLARPDYPAMPNHTDPVPMPQRRG